ncbi:hypothetical protein AOQ71_22585 [Bradyrhizobium manausense]|uniref:Uncharacterized protein n=1 Tax=Bradyrhizobium manausense TaxID=989370 RepID=A0A0R3DE15_9BRAD|nr:hypothetical protein AOQ71_22585 [Bradyrhizobium manausense]
MLPVFICVNLDSLSGSKEADLEKKPRRGIRSVEIAFRTPALCRRASRPWPRRKIAPLAGLTTSAAHLIEREWGAVFGGKTESRD